MDRIITLIIIYFVLKKFLSALTKPQTERQKRGPGHAPSPHHDQRIPQRKGESPVPTQGPPSPLSNQEDSYSQSHAHHPNEGFHPEQASHLKPHKIIHTDLYLQKQAQSQDFKRKEGDNLDIEEEILSIMEETSMAIEAILPEGHETSKIENPMDDAFDRLYLFRQGIIMSEILGLPMSKRNMRPAKLHKRA